MLGGGECRGEGVQRRVSGIIAFPLPSARFARNAPLPGLPVGDPRLSSCKVRMLSHVSSSVSACPLGLGITIKIESDRGFISAEPIITKTCFLWLVDVATPSTYIERFISVVITFSDFRFDHIFKFSSAFSIFNAFM